MVASCQDVPSFWRTLSCSALVLSCNKAMRSDCLVLGVQSGNWASGTPGWLPAARIFLLGSIVFGYLFSAALYLLSARLISGDKLKLETVMQSGSLDAVSANSWFCYCPSMPCFWHQRTYEI